MLADDFLQQGFTPNNRAELEAVTWPRFWVFSLALWLSNLPRLAAFILLGFALMQLLQLGNLSFFGEPLSAIDIQACWATPRRCARRCGSVCPNTGRCCCAWGLPYGLLIALHLQCPAGAAAGQSLGADPDRRGAAVQTLSRHLSQPRCLRASPARSGLHNSLNAFSAWAVRPGGRDDVVLLPPTAYAPYGLAPVPSSARHVWLVVADSLRSDRLGAFGYARDTTPKLSAYLAAIPKR